MARIVVFTHELDYFVTPRLGFPPWRKCYFLNDILRETERLGHSCRIVRGPRKVSGDIALLHVDSTIVPPEYLELGEGFARTLNFRTVDISKRAVSGAILAKGDAWDGKVIIKSNLNFAGIKEVEHNERAARRGAPPPYPAAARAEYVVLDRIEDVPADVWDDPDRVVERFLPEVVEDGYAMRVWLFMGAREISKQYVSTSPIIKAKNTIRTTVVEPPAELREIRRRLGFDYGKLDYVVHDGKVVLFDANRTPGAPPTRFGSPRQVMRDFAYGLHELVPSTAAGALAEGSIGA